MIDDTGEAFDFEEDVVNHGTFARAAQIGGERLHYVANRGKGRVADAMEMAADELDDRLSHAAHYLRTHDVEVIRSDLIQQVRRHPWLSAGIAVGTGYLIGKALSGNPRRGTGGRLRAIAGRQLRRALVASLAAAVATRRSDDAIER